MLPVLVRIMYTKDNDIRLKHVQNGFSQASQPNWPYSDTSGRIFSSKNLLYSNLNSLTLKCQFDKNSLPVCWWPNDQDTSFRYTKTIGRRDIHDNLKSSNGLNKSLIVLHLVWLTDKDSCVLVKVDRWQDTQGNLSTPGSMIVYFIAHRSITSSLHLQHLHVLRLIQTTVLKLKMAGWCVRCPLWVSHWPWKTRAVDMMRDAATSAYHGKSCIHDYNMNQFVSGSDWKYNERSDLLNFKYFLMLLRIDKGLQGSVIIGCSELVEEMLCFHSVVPRKCSPWCFQQSYQSHVSWIMWAPTVLTQTKVLRYRSDRLLLCHPVPPALWDSLPQCCSMIVVYLLCVSLCRCLEPVSWICQKSCFAQSYTSCLSLIEYGWRLCASGSFICQPGELQRSNSTLQQSRKLRSCQDWLAIFRRHQVHLYRVCVWLPTTTPWSMQVISHEFKMLQQSGKEDSCLSPYYYSSVSVSFEYTIQVLSWNICAGRPIEQRQSIFWTICPRAGTPLRIKTDQSWCLSLTHWSRKGDCKWWAHLKLQDRTSLPFRDP